LFEKRSATERFFNSRVERLTVYYFIYNFSNPNWNKAEILYKIAGQNCAESSTEYRGYKFLIKA